jgi:hypothetical protein
MVARPKRIAGEAADRRWLRVVGGKAGGNGVVGWVVEDGG